MKDNFDAALKKLLAHEGGFVNHPSDPGGMTNLGVTKAVWDAWTKSKSTESEMRALKPADVGPLYKARYWDAIRGDDLPAGVDYAVFDAAVNSGPGQAAKWLQRAVDVADDGSIGPATLKAISDFSAVEVVRKVSEHRLQFLQRLKTWPVFGKGWGRRVEEVSAVAQKMAGGK